MLSSMQSGAGVKVKWSEEALQRMERIPDFVRPMVRSGVEMYATKKGYQVITPTVVEESKAMMGGDMGELPWTPAAQQRLENIPAFIRPLARQEIERIARERGLASITDAVMDEMKDKFGQFMSGQYMGF
jgi:hypothetical protein